MHENIVDSLDRINASLRRNNYLLIELMERVLNTDTVVVTDEMIEAAEAKVHA